MRCAANCDSGAGERGLNENGPETLSQVLSRSGLFARHNNLQLDRKSQAAIWDPSDPPPMPPRDVAQRPPVGTCSDDWSGGRDALHLVDWGKLAVVVGAVSGGFWGWLG